MTRPAFITSLVAEGQRRWQGLLGDDDMRSLLTRSAGAMGWFALRFGSNSVIRLLSNFLMVRLLMPEAFGLMALSFTITAAVVLLTDIGLRGSVIRSDNGSDPRFLRTVFTVQLIRNGVLAGLVVGAAQLLRVFHDKLPEGSIWALDITPTFISVAALQLVIAGIQSPSVILAERNMDLKRLTVVATSLHILSVIVMVFCARAGLGPWSLLIGTLGGGFLTAIASHIFIKGPRMSLMIDRAYFMEIFHFGKWLLLASFAGFFVMQGDKFLLGSLFSSTEFSFYVVAVVWVNVVSQLLGSLAGQIGMPAIAACSRENRKNLVGVYKRMRLFMDLACLGAFAALLFGGDLLLTVYLPADYEAAKVFLPPAAAVLLTRPYVLLQQVLLVSGDSKSYSGTQIVGAITMLFAVPFAYQQFGAIICIIVFAMMPLCALPLIYRAVRPHLRLDLLTEVRVLVLGALIGALYIAIF